ncbi:MAG TPA: biotin/lipoyl-binding protein, partial [Gemmatimonadaceae bacterium]
MSAPADLSRLRIDRHEPSAPERNAFVRNVVLFGVALAVVAVGVFVIRARAIPAVTVVTVTATTSGAGQQGGATSVTANGYVVARTKASVSSKMPGRLAYLGVSEGSNVQRGQVIARLDNNDLEAAV